MGPDPALARNSSRLKLQLTSSCSSTALSLPLSLFRSLGLFQLESLASSIGEAAEMNEHGDEAADEDEKDVVPVRLGLSIFEQ